MLKSTMIGVALGAFAWFGVAEAATVTVSVSGVLTDGLDYSNNFGLTAKANPDGHDLTGLNALVTYVFDTSKPATYTALTAGIAGFNQDSPGVLATVTIGNNPASRVSFSGDSYGAIVANRIDDNVSQFAENISSSNNDSVYSTVNVPLSFTQSLFQSPVNITGLKSSTDGSNITRFQLADQSFGDFTANSVSISVVPLPSSLPLFAAAVLGLGLTTALRKRNASNATL